MNGRRNENPYWTRAKRKQQAGSNATEAIRKTPTDNVKHEASTKLLPPNERRDEIMLKYVSRLKILPDSHMNQELRWQNGRVFS